jgi:hypothetical protein
MSRICWEPESVVKGKEYSTILEQDVPGVPGVAVDVKIIKIDSFDNCSKQLMHINRFVQPEATKQTQKTLATKAAALPATSSSSSADHIDHESLIRKANERIEKLEAQLRACQESVRKLSTENRLHLAQINDLKKVFTREEILNILRMSKLWIACFGTPNDLTSMTVYCSDIESDLSILHKDYPDVLVKSTIVQNVFTELARGEMTVTQAIRDLIKHLIESKSEWLQGGDYILVKYKQQCDAVEKFLNELKVELKFEFTNSIFKKLIRQISHDLKPKKTNTLDLSPYAEKVNRHFINFIFKKLCHALKYLFNLLEP